MPSLKIKRSWKDALVKDVKIEKIYSLSKLKRYFLDAVRYLKTVFISLGTLLKQTLSFLLLALPLVGLAFICYYFLEGFTRKYYIIKT